MKELKKFGRVALITGGTRGIGFGVVERLLNSGWKVATVGTDSIAVAALQKRFKDYSFLIKCLSVEYIDGFRAFIDEVERTLGPIDALVNNAAILGPIGPIGEASANQIDQVVAINLAATIHISSIVLRKMAEKNLLGVVVNMSSKASGGVPGLAIYSSIKAAINTFSIAIAHEYRSKGIHIFAMNPGRVDTDLFEKARSIDPKILSYASELNRVKLEGLVLPLAISSAQVEFLLNNPHYFDTGRMVHFDEIQKVIDAEKEVNSDVKLKSVQ